MKLAEFWNVNNVQSFRGIDVDNGEVSYSESEFADYLTEQYGTVTVCGQTFDSGQILKECDETAFNQMKNDQEDYLQRELQDQLDREDSADIEFIDGDEWSLDDEDE